MRGLLAQAGRVLQGSVKWQSSAGHTLIVVLLSLALLGHLDRYSFHMLTLTRLLVRHI